MYNIPIHDLDFWDISNIRISSRLSSCHQNFLKTDQMMPTKFKWSTVDHFFLIFLRLVGVTVHIQFLVHGILHLFLEMWYGLLPKNGASVSHLPRFFCTFLEWRLIHSLKCSLIFHGNKKFILKGNWCLWLGMWESLYVRDMLFWYTHAKSYYAPYGFRCETLRIKVFFHSLVVNAVVLD